MSGTPSAAPKPIKVEALEKNPHLEKFIKHEKIEKFEHKEKPEKLEHKEKPEKHEHKEKPEKFEHKEKPEKHEHKEKPEKFEHKEIAKIEHVEKQIFEKNDKELAEGLPPIDQGDPLARLAALEQSMTEVQHFITTGQRPDLSRGALAGEANVKKPG